MERTDPLEVESAISASAAAGGSSERAAAPNTRRPPRRPAKMVTTATGSTVNFAFDLFDLFILLYVASTVGPLFFPTDSPTLTLSRPRSRRSGEPGDASSGRGGVQPLRRPARPAKRTMLVTVGGVSQPPP
ncbi:hypothetical protein HBB16_03955 [Pseudonocardia sp. MCCB 268]|nr:hypothetical protein [Pseudonocardia cytotoxica]